jgi:predicted neutral ceramidase superfamily lipid hydrolase
LGHAREPAISDSLKLALVSAGGALLAYSSWLPRLNIETARTIGFLLYFAWPFFSIVFLWLVALFAIRDMQRERIAQGAAALVIAVAVLAFSFARLAGWE